MTHDLGPDARALLDAARGALAPDAAAIRRMRAKIDASIAGGAGAGAGADAGPGAGTRAGTGTGAKAGAGAGALAAKIGVVAVAAAIAVSVIVYGYGRRGEPPSKPRVELAVRPEAPRAAEGTAPRAAEAPAARVAEAPAARVAEAPAARAAEAAAARAAEAVPQLDPEIELDPPARAVDPKQPPRAPAPAHATEPPRPARTAGSAAPPSPAARPSRSPSGPRRADIAREVELVDQAMAALRGGQLSAALAAVRLHGAETAGAGQLAEDAAAIEIEALCRMHDPAAAARLSAFDARWPQSAQRSRLTTRCP